jgi:hypothetical protein
MGVRGRVRNFHHREHGEHRVLRRAVLVSARLDGWIQKFAAPLSPCSEMVTTILRAPGTVY